MKTEHELIMAIVNAGFSGDIMEAARSAGAYGGTIMHARGTANQKAEKEFEITVNPEKDLVMIVVKSEIKDDVLKAIYEQAGLNTDGHGVAFSVPVTNTVGIK